MNDALKIIMNSQIYKEQFSNKDQIFEDKDVPSGFEIIGDIAHVNLN